MIDRNNETNLYIFISQNQKSCKIGESPTKFLSILEANNETAPGAAIWAYLRSL
jgi:hypothetical protein